MYKLNRRTNHSTTAGPPLFKISFAIPSSPDAFPFFYLFTASSVSCCSITLWSPTFLPVTPPLPITLYIYQENTSSFHNFGLRGSVDLKICYINA
jgi:hypothetical protein